MTVPTVRERARTQSGYTLVELLIAIAVAVVISLPLTAWVVLALDQQPTTRDGLVRTNATGLLGSAFPGDVAVAGKAAVSGEGLGEPWAADCGAGRADNGSVQLVLVTGGTDVEKIVYTVADRSDGASRDPSRKSIWRRTCAAGPGGAVTDEQELFADVRVGSTVVTCSSEPGDAPCRQIALRTTPVSDDREIRVSATRRLDEESVPTDSSGVPLPTARIQLVERNGTQAMTATFSGTASSAAAGRSIVSYQWEFESDRGVTADSTTAATVTASFPAAGSYTVLLTVTDDGGGSNTHLLQISSANLSPVAVIGSISPDPVSAGAPVTLSSAGSFDPDGAVARIEWSLNVPGPGGTSDVVALEGASPVWTAPAGTVGTVSVTLTVTDTQLGRSSAFSSFLVLDPSAPTSTTVPTDPGDPGALVARFTDAPGGSPAQRSFDASSTTGADAGATFSWVFGDGATGSGAQATHTYPNSGEYPVRLTVVTGDNRSATVQRTVNVGGAPPAPTDIRAVGSNLVWSPVPGANRYLVDFVFTATGCDRAILDQVVAVGPSPSKAIPANPCTGVTQAVARVGTVANGATTWSGQVSFPADAGGA
jgi:prepilin-type N-terminal cleavage/methylation domain-containing protein